MFSSFTNTFKRKNISTPEVTPVLVPQELETAPVLEPEILETAPVLEPEILDVAPVASAPPPVAVAAPAPAPTVPDPVLVFYSDALDYSGSGKVWTTRTGNDGNLNGNPVYTAAAPTYFTFDGSGDYNQTSYDAATRTTTVSIEQWLLAPDWTAGSSSSYKTALSCAEYGGYRCSIDGSDFISIVYANGDYVVARTDASALKNNRWHHFVTTYDGQYLKLYVDGALKRKVNAGGKYPITYSKSNSLLMGAEASSGSGSDGKYWTGRIALTRIYDGAWSEAGVAKLYEENKARFVN